MSNDTFQWVQISEKNYSYSSKNDHDKNLIKVFLTSYCEGGLNNSHQVPELAFVWFPLCRAWELRSLQPLCERSPPTGQRHNCCTKWHFSPFGWRAAALCVDIIRLTRAPTNMRVRNSLNPDCLHCNLYTVDAGMQSSKFRGKKLK